MANKAGLQVGRSNVQDEGQEYSEGRNGFICVSFKKRERSHARAELKPIIFVIINSMENLDMLYNHTWVTSARRCLIVPKTNLYLSTRRMLQNGQLQRLGYDGIQMQTN